MNNSIEEIKLLEKKLIDAELQPDPDFFVTCLADHAILDGEMLKQKVVDAHQPGGKPKFTKVEMSNFRFYDYGTSVVVTCRGNYTGDTWSGELLFMRVWHKHDGNWKIIARTTSHVSAST